MVRTLRITSNLPPLKIKIAFLILAAGMFAASYSAQAGGLLFRLGYNNTTPEQAAQLDQLYYAELACSNAMKTATDAKAIQQAQKTVSDDLLIVNQFLHMHSEDVLVWENAILYEPAGNGSFNWKLENRF